MWNTLVMFPLAVGSFGVCDCLDWQSDLYQMRNSPYQNGNVYDDGRVRVVDETKAYGELLKSAAGEQDKSLLKDKITTDVLSLGSDAEDFASSLLKKIRSDSNFDKNGDTNEATGRSGSNNPSGSNINYRSNGSQDSNSSRSTDDNIGDNRTLNNKSGNNGVSDNSGGTSNGGSNGSSGCDDEAEDRDGGLFGSIPDIWYCNVFGEVPTFDELFGEN